jgi:hypothetical protein
MTTTMTQSEFNADIMYIVILLSIAILKALIIFIYNKISDILHWHHGCCKCGGSWIYQQAVGHKDCTHYIYICPKCGKIIEVKIKPTLNQQKTQRRTKVKSC